MKAENSQKVADLLNSNIGQSLNITLVIGLHSQISGLIDSIIKEELTQIVEDAKKHAEAAKVAETVDGSK